MRFERNFYLGSPELNHYTPNRFCWCWSCSDCPFRARTGGQRWPLPAFARKRKRGTLLFSAGLSTPRRLVEKALVPDCRLVARTSHGHANILRSHAPPAIVNLRIGEGMEQPSRNRAERTRSSGCADSVAIPYPILEEFGGEGISAIRWFNPKFWAGDAPGN